jgi:hypothetical protein
MEIAYPRLAMLAQCAMCKANLAHAENPAATANSINKAILLLLFPTLLIIGGLIRMIFHYRNLQNDHVHLRSSDTERMPQ